MSANAAKNAHEVVLRELLARVSAGKALDAPCGSGSLASRMSNAGLDVIGLDIEPPDTTDNFEIRRADLGAALPIPDAAIENAVSVEGIEHLERPFEFVRECYRVLRDRGLLIVTTPKISSLRSRWRWLLTGFHYKCKYALLSQASLHIAHKRLQDRESHHKSHQTNQLAVYTFSPTGLRRVKAGDRCGEGPRNQPSRQP